MSLTAKLRELSKADDEATTSPFAGNCEQGYVSLLLDHPDLVSSAVKHLRPQQFSKIECQYVVAEILDYYRRHDSVPTRDVLRDIASKSITEDDPFEEVFATIDRKSNQREVMYLKQEMRNWLKCQGYRRLLSDEGQEAILCGNYELVDEIIADAKAVYGEDEDDFGFMTVSELMARRTERTWLINDVLVADQPCLVGGKKKVLKTGILCDLVVSLATGTKFLDHFEVAKPTKAAFFSCESGEDDIRDRIEAICRQRKVKPDPANLLLSFNKPRLSDDAHLARIGKFLDKSGAQVLIVDPLYLTLLAGNKEASSANLYDMGDVLARISDVCAPRGVTLILCHHFKKTASDDLDLDDLTFTGAAEFARQSILIGRRAPFETPTDNQLKIRFHGFGRGGLFHVDINEGEPSDQQWLVKVEAKQECERRERIKKADQNLGLLLNAMADLSEEDPEKPLSKNQLREALGWSGDKVTRVLRDAIDEGRAEEVSEGGRGLFRRLS